MKKIFSWFIFVAVAAQVIWLAWNYHARSEELATAPRILISAQPYDPRDLTRGYYQSLNCMVRLNAEQVSAILGCSVNRTELPQKLLNNHQLGSEYTYILTTNFTPPEPHSATAEEIPANAYESFTLSTFWVKRDSGLWEISRAELPNSPEDVAAAGEIRIPMAAKWDIQHCTNEVNKTVTFDISLGLRFPGMQSLRYYYPEELGDFFSLLRQKEHTVPVDITVELAIRPTASIIPTQLYLNGIPYNEATELLKQDKFPFREHPQP